MGTVIYTRISKDDKKDELGVDRQERLCRDLAKKLRLKVDRVYVENDTSASNRKKRRPVFDELVADMAAGHVSTLLAYHSDRLYRRNADLEKLVDIFDTYQVEVHTARAGRVDLSTAAGRFSARQMGALAQYEIEHMVERLKDEIDERALAGRPHGGRPPFGYGPGNVPDEREALLVRFMLGRVLEDRSLLSVARELEENGWPMRNGSLRWHHSRVRQIITKPSIAGLRVHRGEVVGPATWEPIVDRSDWDRVCAVLSDPARKNRRPATKYLLSGFLRSVTDDPMVGHGGSPTRYTTSFRAVTATSVKAEDIEVWFEPIIIDYLTKFQLPKAAPPAPSKASVIEAELAELAQLRSDGVISLNEWLIAREGPMARLAAERPTTDRPPVVRLLEVPGAAAKKWPSMTFLDKRVVMGAVVEWIKVGPATRGRWTPLEERLDYHQGYGVKFKF